MFGLMAREEDDVTARGQSRISLRSRVRDSALVLACILAVVVLSMVLAPARADAYLVRQPVYLGLSQSSVELQVGQSAAISCVIDPLTEDQLPGCMESYCPEGCGDGMACLDANGWCTCMGGGYARYETTVVTMSSDPSVARAGWSGGVLSVNAQDVPGTAVITISASLRNHAPDQVAYVNVVVDPLPSDYEDEFVGDDEGEGEGDGQGESEGDGAGDGTDGGQGDADTNVIDGTGDDQDANLDPNARADEGATYDKPAAAKDSGGHDEQAASDTASDAPVERDAPVEPEVPEVPVEPDVQKPVRLYELEEVESEDDEQHGLDSRYVGITSAASLLCMGFGAVRRAEYRRRQLS